MLDIIGKGAVPAAVVIALAWGLAGAAAHAQTETLAELMAEGGPLYSDNCAACHGAEGRGTGSGPALDRNANLESRPMVVNQVLWGQIEHGMPPFADLLDDRQIAAVGTYIRNAWHNDMGIIFPRSVELRR